ncbi:MAG: putative glycoside hydrolase [Fuerstiella sp.]
MILCSSKMINRCLRLSIAITVWQTSWALAADPQSIPTPANKHDRALQISDGSRFVPQDFYPDFSWDTAPLYYMFGDKNRVLRPEQVRFIAERTGFLCIEKSHGMGQLGAAELGAKHETAAFKKINPKVKVLFYFNAAYAWPYTSYNKNFTRRQIESHPELEKFLLPHPKTGKLADQFGAFCFDVLNSDFRNWWVETVAKGVEASGSDGTFIDQMHGNLKLRPDKGLEIEKAMGQMMAALKQRLGPDKILLANNAYNSDAKHVYPVSDAIMFENYATVKSSKESLLAEWGHMLKNAQDGKISVFRLGVEGTGRRNLKPNMPKHSQQKAEFALACYLIGAQPYSYFMYSWGWKLSSGALVDYPEFKKRLGPPQGAYNRTTPDGWQFTREFEHASVWVDTEARQAKIIWR